MLEAGLLGITFLTVLGLVLLICVQAYQNANAVNNLVAVFIDNQKNLVQNLLAIQSLLQNNLSSFANTPGRSAELIAPNAQEVPPQQEVLFQRELKLAPGQTAMDIDIKIDKPPLQNKTENVVQIVDEMSPNTTTSLSVKNGIPFKGKH